MQGPQVPQELFFHRSIAALAASDRFDRSLLSKGADLGLRSTSNSHMAGFLDIS